LKQDTHILPLMIDWTGSNLKIN